MNDDAGNVTSFDSGSSSTIAAEPQPVDGVIRKVVKEEVLEAEGEQSTCLFHVRRWDKLTKGVDLRLILPQPARGLY